jgi:hypothetical protein
LRWNGVRWRSVHVPGSSFQANFLAASGPDDVWLLGTAAATAVTEAFRFNGTAWHAVPMPAVGTPGLPVVLSATDVWFLQNWYCTSVKGHLQSCSTDVWHWDGHSWKSQVLNRAVVAMGGVQGHVWLAELTSPQFPGSGSPTGRLALFRLDGGGWRRIWFSSPRVDGFFVTVAASSAKDLWVVARPVRQTAQQSGVFHYNGRHWMQLRVPLSQPTQLVPAMPDGLGGVWLGPWAHWTGRRWVDTIPLGGFRGVDCFSINGLATVPGSSYVWGAGWAHRIGARDQLNAMLARYGLPQSGPASSAVAARRPVCVVGTASLRRSALP